MPEAAVCPACFRISKEASVTGSRYKDWLLYQRRLEGFEQKLDVLT